MKNTKVRAQQILMTVGCIVFLVWVGIRGMNERKGDTKETDTAVEKLSLASEGVQVQHTTEEIVVVNQVYATQIAQLPSMYIRADKAGELVQLKVDINSRIEMGQEIALLRVAKADTIGLGNLNRKVKVAKQNVKDKLEQLLAIDRGEEGGDAKEKYEKQYALYNEAKKELAEYERQENKLTTSSPVKYVETTIKAPKEGIVKQVLVGAGRPIELNQPLLTIQSGASKVVQIEVTSENYLLVRNHLPQVRAKVIFKDNSSYQLPASVVASLNQKSISEDGKIRITFDVSAIPNIADIQKMELSILNIPTKVLDERALFMRGDTAYIWTLGEENRLEATPVNVVKKEKGKIYVQNSNVTIWNRVLVGDLRGIKEGEKLVEKN